MEATYTVIAETEDEARTRLAEMCRALGLVPKYGGRAMPSFGSGRFMCTAGPALDADVAPPFRRD